MSTIARNVKAKDAARPFLESIFQAPGTTIATADIIARAIKAGVNASGSTIMGVAARLVAEGFLTQTQRGFFTRADPKGTPLDIPGAPAPDPGLSAEASLLLRFAGLESRLVAMQASVDALTALTQSQSSMIQALLTNLGVGV